MPGVKHYSEVHGLQVGIVMLMQVGAQICLGIGLKSIFIHSYDKVLGNDPGRNMGVHGLPKINFHLRGELGNILGS